MANSNRSELVKRSDVPEHIADWFKQPHQEARFAAPVTVELDTERVIKLSKQGISKPDAEAIAFLLWRARMVRRYAGATVKMSWPDAVEHALLRDEVFRVCNERRQRAIAEREARKERLESVQFYSVNDANAEETERYNRAVSLVKLAEDTQNAA
jgi:hypothetical protein